MRAIRFTDCVSSSLVDYSVEFDDTGFEIKRSHWGYSGWEPVKNPDDALLLKAKYHLAISHGPHAQLIRATLEAVRDGAVEIERMIREEPRKAFKRVLHGRRQKAILNIDRLAERRAIKKIESMLHGQSCKPLIFGEETYLPESFDLSRVDTPVVSLDMVDGTDELEQGTDLWCSAATVYLPKDDHILASFVAVPGRGMYFATGGLVGRCRHRKGSLSPEVFKLDGPSRVERISESLLACYGHKGGRLNAMFDHPGYRDLIGHQLASTRGRIRTEAGNPWIIRMVDGFQFRRPDAVFDLFGQAPHDIVPAADIAIKTGAIMLKMDGSPIRPGSLLRQPVSSVARVPYILANPKLAARIQKSLSAGSWDRELTVAHKGFLTQAVRIH